MTKLQVEDPSCNGSDDNNKPNKDTEEKLRKEVEHFESLSKTLMIKESMSNRELQDARKEVIEVSLLLFLLLCHG